MATGHFYDGNYHQRKTIVYPIHSACMNECCVDAIIELLVQKNPSALRHLCIAEEYGVNTGEFDSSYDACCVEGTPLHYYLAREANINLEVVQKLVEACPGILTMADNESKYTPLHSHVCNLGIDVDIVRYLVEKEASALQVACGYDMTPLHLACANGTTNARVIEFLLNAWSESMYRRDNLGELPIHTLCGNSQLDDATSLEICNVFLERDPGLIRDADTDEGRLPIHFAVRSKSFQFCKTLIDADPESVGMETGGRWLPFHYACAGGHLDTVKYLLELRPGDLSRRTEWRGHLPIHAASGYCAERNTEIIKYLLSKDPESATRFSDRGQRLPLHLLCYSGPACLEAVQVLFDQHPWALSVEDEDGNTPIDLARKRNSEFSTVANFLDSQLAYYFQAQNMHDMTRLDGNGWLPLHRALRNNACLGAIKLLASGNPSALRIADGKLAFPIHLACEFGSADVVKYLLELDNSWLHHSDSDGNSTLHYACRGGNFGVVNYLLQRNVPCRSLKRIETTSSPFSCYSRPERVKWTSKAAPRSSKPSGACS